MKIHSVFAILLTTVFAAVLCFPEAMATAQVIKMVSETDVAGKVHSVKPGQITVEKPDGTLVKCKIQNKNEQAVSLEGGEIVVALPAQIAVGGIVSASLLEPGMIVEFSVRMNKKLETETPVKTFEIVNLPAEELRLQHGDSLKPNEFMDCNVAGRVISLKNNKLALFVQKSKATPKNRVVVQIDLEGTLEMHDDHLNRVVPGDQVNSMTVVEFSNKDMVVKKIDVTYIAKREKATSSYNDQLEQKHSQLSDEPQQPRTLTSDHFIIHTDVSNRSAAVLLDKLERMYNLIGRYFGKRPKQPIECFVVSDLSLFEGQLPPDGAAKIAEGAGVTMMAKAGGMPISIVFSCDDHGVVQHEAVHAYCFLAFGECGPIWFAEGMAEMGQYWKPDELGVSIDPVVIDYLMNAKKKKLEDIVAEKQITGDSWQAYAWRWAICHLLSSHPTHGMAFKKLALGMMNGAEVSFATSFGPVAKQLSFEYDQFVENFGNGYRVDLCVWDWTTPAASLSGVARSKTEVEAMKGWQASGLQVEKDKSYDYVAQGTWLVRRDDAPVDADGNDRGNGKLIGAVFSNTDQGYQLFEPFEMGVKGTMVGPSNGQLFVRCREDWTDIGDNSGKVTLHFRITPEN